MKFLKEAIAAGFALVSVAATTEQTEAAPKSFYATACTKDSISVRRQFSAEANEQSAIKSAYSSVVSSRTAAQVRTPDAWNAMRAAAAKKGVNFGPANLIKGKQFESKPGC